MIKLNICDGTLSGRVIQQFLLPIATTRISARELIVERVRYEVTQQQLPTHRYTLITPTETEALLNDYANQPRPCIDAEAACAKALRAFERNGFVLLVDEQQITALDQALTIHEHSVVQFVKLIPLVGG
jgi:hypothetical protein